MNVEIASSQTQTEKPLAELQAEYGASRAALDALGHRYATEHVPHDPVTERTPEGRYLDGSHESAWLQHRRQEIAEEGVQIRAETRTWAAAQIKQQEDWRDAQGLGQGRQVEVEQGEQTTEAQQGEVPTETIEDSESHSVDDTTTEQQPPDADRLITSLVAKQPELPRNRNQLKLPSRLTRRLIENLFWRKMCDEATPEDWERVVANPEVRALIHNDGNSTIVVHSGRPATAEAAFTDGFKLEAKFDDSTKPGLYYTGFMLAGPRDRQQTALNAHLMAYRYRNVPNGEPSPNSAKLVMIFPVPNPGTARKTDPFKNTFLERVDGGNVVRIPQEGRFDYAVPAARILGYFDQETGVFVRNPNFSAAATVAPLS